MKVKNFFKAVAFIVLFLFTLSYLTHLLAVSTAPEEYQWMSGIYEEPENSLDAVYLGSSNCYAYWNQCVAWQKYGIAVAPYTCSSQPFLVTEYLIKEARKTQPNAVYIVNTNTLETTFNVVLHRLLDHMPLSKNKVELANYLFNIKELSFKERLEYCLPIISYHNLKIKEEGFVPPSNEFKNTDIKEKYLKKVHDATDDYIYTSKTCEMSDQLKKSLNSLMSYCKKEKLKVLFVTVPRSEETKKDLKTINKVNSVLKENGFDTLDLMNSTDEMDISLKYDFYNKNHTNIHGSVKYTKYLSEYLIKKYGFKDKRKNKNYQSWNQAAKSYLEYTKPYILDFETNFNHRDYSLDKPASFKAEEKRTKIILTYKSVENADGYAIYRNTDEGAWNFIDSTKALEYTDKNVKKGKKYHYAVVPYSVKNGKKMYGYYKYGGLSASLEE